MYINYSVEILVTKKLFLFFTSTQLLCVRIHLSDDHFRRSLLLLLLLLLLFVGGSFFFHFILESIIIR
jgi:hypothetical protein